jgi:soluble lytic murein transglycosylase
MQFSAILTPLVLAACVFFPSLSVCQAQGRDSARFDEAITDMAQAYKARDRKRLTALLPQVRGSVLEPWGAYWELSARLDEASSSEIQDFFTRFSGSYQEDKLRTEWLLQLGRNRDWGAFNREYPKYRMGDDKSLRCYGLLAERLANGADVSAAVLQNWFALKEADEGCAAAAEQLVKEHAIQFSAVWPRARLGFENDRLRVATQAAGILNEAWAKNVAEIYASPAKYLNDKLTAFRPKTRELVSLAIIRLAYLDTEAAATEVNHLRWKAQLTQEERSWIWGVIGKRAALKMSNDAVGYFAQGQFSQMHEDHLAWAVRAALRAGKWKMVHDAIVAMPSAMAAEPVWVYWHARAQLALADSEATRAEALNLLQGIASVRGFYEQLALEELGQRITVPERPAPLTVEEREAARNNPGLNRALYAIQIGLRSEGVREWNYSTNLHVRGGLDDRALLAAAERACQAEVWDRCINSSERTKTVVDMEQRFPMPFKNAVLARTKQIGLDPAYVYGLIRQESRFIMDARSGVGASGLMQVMPATAKWTAKKIGMTDFQPHQISDRDTNIAIGTGYLKLLQDSFRGSMPLAAAAYNAGPGRPRAWRNGPVLDAAIWAENIPFNETRDYVKKVLSNTTNYAALITGQPQSLKARLGQVGPLDASTPDTSTELP